MMMRKMVLGWGLMCLTNMVYAETSVRQNFLRGGEFCFSLNQPALTQWRETFKLQLSPNNPGRSDRLPLVSGLQHGVLLNSPQAFEYISQVSGMASLGANNQYSISLTGNQSGYDLQGQYPGIWISHMVLTLNKRDLTGSAIGFKQFRPVHDGKVWDAFEDSVDVLIHPISCSDF